MKLTVQLVVQADDDAPAIVREVFEVKPGELGPETLGLGLAEAKDLLAAVQATMVDEQLKAALAARAACPHCAPHAATRVPTRS